MKVALIHDHLAQDGGAEKVLRALADLFPDAPIYTLLYDKKNVDKYFKDRRIETSIIQRLPGGVRFYQWYMPFMPMAVEFYDLRDFDVVISDASAFAKGVITSPETLHICYCHTPTRYLWDYTHQYINELNYNKYFKKVISMVLNKIRIWDRLAADRVDVFVANSETVKKRIAKYYRRDATVVYPPVSTGNFRIGKPGDYYLIGGRLAPYKRVDIVIEAFRGSDRKLKVFGDGVDLERLKNIAGGAENIEFLGRLSDEKMAEYYAGCLAFINPQEEDFGITVVEAMASGRPVLAYRKGGALETVLPGVTGEFFDEQTPASIRRCLDGFDPGKYDQARIRNKAEAFSETKFKERISALIKEEFQKFNSKL
jgi:glycosyltransferase involved in cell wall biosynthesis